MVKLPGVGSDSAKVSTSVPQAAPRSDDESGHRHRQVIGWIGLVLPAVLILMVVSRDGLKVWRNLESISAYYYTGAVAPFVGMLVALALYLLAYQGYNNQYKWADKWAARAAAGAAVVLALFPTKEPVGVSPLPWWTPTMGVVHHLAAIILFTMFAIFALWLFRLTADGEQPPADKRRRNKIYLVCGIVIVVCIAWAGFNGLTGRPIFWPESFALIAFAMSWLVKGDALRPVVRSLRRS